MSDATDSSYKHPVVHFEMPYKDKERLSAFYTEAFGWKMKDFGPDAGDYVTAETTETANGRPTTAGAINGGFFAFKPDWPAQYPSVVIYCDDIQEAVQHVTTAGGEVLGEPMHIPGVGTYVSFLDTEGNRASLLQPGM